MPLLPAPEATVASEPDKESTIRIWTDGLSWFSSEGLGTPQQRGGHPPRQVFQIL